MLTSPRPKGRRAPAPQSLRQEYEEYVLQRIEEFKDQMSREKLLSLADEAVRELDADAAEQLVLTEVLVLEHVDRLIVRRLRLQPYRRWREQHLKLRTAQQEPAHWGLPRDTPLPRLAARLDRGDQAVVVGAGAVSAALYLSAQDVPVLLLGDDIAAVEAAEARAAAEAVGSRFQALVVTLGGWFPVVTPSLVVIDAGAIAVLTATERKEVVDGLKEQTRPGGVHCILQPDRGQDVIPLAPEALQTHYSDWMVERARRGGARARWILATKP